MKLCKKLYFGECALEQKKEILSYIKRRKWQFGIYVITLSENEENLLDVYETIQFEQNYYKKKKLSIVGVAVGREEAFELVGEIINDVFKKTGAFNVKDYFLTEKE